MAVACAGGKGPHLGCRVGRGWSRPHQRRARKISGHAVKVGDVLTVGLDNSVRILKVVGFSERRGDASAARVLYDDLQNARE